LLESGLMQASAIATSVLLLSIAIAGPAEAGPDAAGPPAWALEVAVGYGISGVPDRAEPAAHVGAIRTRLLRSLVSWPAGTLGLGLELHGALGPLPHGELGAGAVLGWRLPLGGQGRIADGGQAFVTQLELHTALAGGWTYATSGLSEGHITVADGAVAYHGPYGRAELGPRLRLELDRPGAPRQVAITVGLVAGVTFVHARNRLLASEPPWWRAGGDLLLAVGLCW
jgi:hypothetical protein